MTLRKLAAAVFFLTCGTAHAQHDVDTGGDPLMLVFNKAKFDAAWMIDLVKDAGIPLSVNARVRDFVNQNDLAADIRASEQVWHAGDVFEERCAVTNVRDTPGGAPNPRKIHLSLTRCRSVLLATTTGESEAVRTLIHEAVHHFGVSGSAADEDFASLVGTVVFNLWQASRRAGVPQWYATATPDAPVARYLHTAVWTGEGEGAYHGQVIVWGGCNESPQPNREKCGRYLDNGARLVVPGADGSGALPATSWLPLTPAKSPYGRVLHSAVWTGDADITALKNKMLIFGGCQGSDVACTDSFAASACPQNNCDAARENLALFDPAENAWSPVAVTAEPSPRVMHSAVWTGDSMVVFGGYSGYQNPSIPDLALNDGGTLVFSDAQPQGVWQPLPAANAPSARYLHTAVWTGNDRGMLIWGGCRRAGLRGCAQALNDGGFLQPTLDGDGHVISWHWVPITGSALVDGRVNHAAVWTGRYLIVTGGENEGGPVENGAIYDSESGRWLDMTTTLPVGEGWRRGATAAWDGLQGRMIVWGGVTGEEDFPESTLIYDPADGPGGRYSLAATDVSPIGRKGHTGVWVHDSLIVWGGFGASRSFLGTGGMLRP